jgi:LuxR family maltose regulon positive regulatory protein
MYTTLLATKLYVPPTGQIQVLRPRLLAALSQALTRRLTLVSAPAGYGKTTLVSHWLRSTGVPSAWLSLDDEDNDPIRFLQYLITALQQILPDLQIDPPGMLHGVQPAASATLMSVLINEIAERAERASPLVLVLDDFHVIHAQSILDMLSFLLERLPPQVHLVIISRTDPPIPLSRLRAQDQLVDIRISQLRFTLDEITAFLNEVMGLGLSSADIASLERRTEGWIAGLQLAALSMKGSDDAHSFVSAFTGSHHYIVDYLVEEVLRLQPESLRSFLLRTSVLERMCAPLCDAVLADQEPKEKSSDETQFSTLNSQATLESLERANLFIIPLDNERRWYRYHHLFADMLNRRLEFLHPRQVPELHLRASRWYEQNEVIPAATQHALMAGDQQRAARLIEQNGCQLIMSGEVVTLLKWIEAVESHAPTHPWLAIQKAWALSLTDHPELVEPTLHSAEQVISALEPTIEVKIMLGTIAAARAYSANKRGETHAAADFARQALEYLPDDNPFSCSIRSVTIAILGDASQMEGNLEQARLAYAEALRIGQVSGNVHTVVMANIDLADVLMRQSELHQAARIFSETLQLATRPDGGRSPLADRVFAGMSSLYYEWNRLEAAGQYTYDCIELCRQWGNFDLLAEAYVTLARLEQAQCRPVEAQRAMRLAGQLQAEHRLSHRRSRWVQSALAHLWISQGDLERASQHLQGIGVSTEGISGSAEIGPLIEHEYLTLLRLRLARGEYEAALALSKLLLQKAESANRIGKVIEILVLRAIAFQGKRDSVQALEALERAVTLAQPQGYLRTFLDEGEPVARLLKASRLKFEGLPRQYADELLIAFSGQKPEEPGLQAGTLVEPLTQRELEVLKLIEAGCSNQEIAARLVISLTTVKRHISNIYAKLDVNSRTQAISRARLLKLFD